MGEKASVTLLFVTLGLLEPISAAWAKKDKVDVTLTEPANGALSHAPAAIVLSAIAQAKQKNHPIVKVEFFQGTNLIGAVAGPRRGDQYTLNWAGVAARATRGIEAAPNKTAANRTLRNIGSYSVRPLIYRPIPRRCA